MEKIHIYIAGGWFNDAQLKTLLDIENIVQKYSDFIMFSPRLESKLDNTNSIEDRRIVFDKNIEAIKDSDVVIVSTVGKDMGTLFEAGYAFAEDKYIIYVNFEDDIKNFNLMLSESGNVCFTDINRFSIFMEKLNRTREFETIPYEGDIE